MEGRERKEKKVEEGFWKTSFMCGIVHHKVGSPYLNDISNLNYTGHAKKMSIKPKKREGQTFA